MMRSGVRSGVILSLLAVFGCADGDVGVTIDRLVEPSSTCEISETSTTLLQSSWDLASGRGYTAGAVVRSQLVRLPSTLGGDPMEFVIEGFEVELRDFDGETPLELPGLNNPYSVRTTGIVTSNNAPTGQSEGVAAAEFIPAEYASGMASVLSSASDVDTLTMELRVFGKTRGGTSVTSVATVRPLQVCNGCLADCAIAATQDVCLPGQDGNAFCPAGAAGSM